MKILLWIILIGLNVGAFAQPENLDDSARKSRSKTEIKIKAKSNSNSKPTAKTAKPSKESSGSSSAKTESFFGPADGTPSRFELQAQFLVRPQGSGTGVSAGAQYYSSPRWGYQGQVINVSKEEKTNSDTSTDTGTSNNNSSVNSTGLSGAVMFTPIPMEKVRLSGLLGAMAFSEGKDVSHKEYTGSGYRTESKTEHGAKFMGFVGISATLTLAKHFGAVGSLKVATDSSYNQAGIGAALLF